MKYKKDIKKKAQGISADILIVVIIILFGALFLVMGKNSVTGDNDVNEKYDEAFLDSKVVVDSFKEKQIISEDNKVDADKLVSLNYEELRQELGVNDFAIVFEKDGKLVKVDPETGRNCIGTDKIIVNGNACS